MIATDSIHAWSGQELLDREDWRIDAAPALERDLDALLAWAGEHADPLATLKTSSLRLPGFDALAARARIALGAVQQWLERHRVQAHVHVEVSSVPAGEALLSRAADWGAQCLVMGGYGHPRWAEFVLGGATRTMLGQMTLPVLMSH